MFRFLILLMGMLTTRAGKLDSGSFRAEDEDAWEDPGPWLEGPAYAADDPWIVAREPGPPALRRREADELRPRRPERIRGARRRLVPRWVKWATVLALAGLVFRKAIAFAVLVTNAVAAVAIGCSLFVIHHFYVRFTNAGSIPGLHTSPGVESTE